MKSLLKLLSLIGIVCSLSTNLYADPVPNYLIGRGMTDITGPLVGVQMWGFGREEQLTEGLHIRQRSRAFIVAEPGNGKRVVFVSADIGSIEHNMSLEVVDRLKAKFGDQYTLENVMLSATHTHAAAGGYWHSRVELGLAGAFYPEVFDRVVDGIVKSIEAAHADLQPGSIFLDTGDVEGAGVNRSMPAYMQNPEEERARYASPIDKEMTLLRFENASGPVGMINWFAVHPTSMTYDNKFVSGDHKGYASLAFEERMGVKYDSVDDFVAAFAQSTPGDVTPNLNLNNTGPGADDFESTAIIGTRQLEVALKLFDEAEEPLSGLIDFRQLYVDMSDFKVEERFTGSGTQVTCPSAYGYSFAGGSTEDGGGHFLFWEGMTEQRFYLDFLVGFLTGAPDWTPEVKQCQEPKPILFETGTGTPPIQSQIRSVGIARIGQLVILTMPTEITTMSARRLKASVGAALGSWATHIVIAGYTNGYAGYVTTPEEYQVQQYEGGHTLHGPWTLPAYQQIVTELAIALETGNTVTNSIAYDDWRGKSVGIRLHDGAVDRVPAPHQFGDAIAMEQSSYSVGDTVTTEFWSANPSARHEAVSNFLSIEYQHDGEWLTVATDKDWETKIRWRSTEEEDALVAQVIWDIPEGMAAGTYRIRHFGEATGMDAVIEFEATSGPIEIN
jgi:neutral ceramidase